MQYHCQILPYFTFYLCYVSSKFAKKTLRYHIMQKIAKHAVKSSYLYHHFWFNLVSRKNGKNVDKLWFWPCAISLNDLVMYWWNTNISIKKWKKLTYFCCSEIGSNIGIQINIPQTLYFFANILLSSLNSISNSSFNSSLNSIKLRIILALFSSFNHQ